MCRCQQIGGENIGNHKGRLFVGTHTKSVAFGAACEKRRADLSCSFDTTNAVCVAEQTANGQSSRLSSSFDAQCTVSSDVLQRWLAVEIGPVLNDVSASPRSKRRH